MKKKLVVGILTGALILGAGTLTFAQTNGFNFEQIQPHIEEVHPNLTEEEQKEMFDACHGDEGMMENQNGENVSNMMNQF